MRARGAITFVLASLGVLVPLNAGAQTAAPAPVRSPADVRTTPDPGLTVLATQQLDPRLQQFTLHTDLLQGAMTHVRVLLPSDYATSGKRYPVLYLYHGGEDDYTAWTTEGNAEAATKGLNLIVVMPDNGPIDYSADWYNGGIGGPPKWATYTFTQLIPWVDATFRTIPERSARAAAGVSLGGYAAMSYVARRPDLYSAVGSFSGQIDTDNPADQALDELIPWVDQINGSFQAQAVRWRGNNPWDLAANLGGEDITLYSRNGSSKTQVVAGHTLPDLERLVHEDTVDVDDRLTQLGIAHTAVDFGAGEHTWTNFDHDLVAWLPHLMKHFASAEHSRPPSSFIYSSIEPQYSVYDWSVAVQRPALEFSTLEVDGGNRFQVIGSGSATVTTGPLYPAGTSYELTVTDAAGTKHEKVAVNAEGRISVSLTLGPGNPQQQYTGAAAAAASPRTAENALPAKDLPFVEGDGSQFFRASVRVMSP